MRYFEKPLGLNAILLLCIAPVTLLVFVAIGGGVIKNVGDSALQTARQQHRLQHQYSLNFVRHHLAVVQDAVRQLAENDLLIHGLLDVTHRVEYLPYFFRSLRIPEIDRADIALVDYRGRTVVASADTARSYGRKPFWEDVSRGIEYFELSAAGMIFAVPLRHQHQMEGALVLRCSLGQLNHIIETGADTFGLTLSGSDGRLLLSSPVPADQRPAWWQAPEAWLVERSPIEGFPGLVFETAVQKARFLAPVRYIRGMLMVLVVLMSAALVICFFLISRTVTRPILEFTRNIDAIRQSENLSIRVNEKNGPREMREIGGAFNQLTASLKRTMVSRSYLIRTANAIPDGIFVTSSDLTLKRANLAFCEMFGCTYGELSNQFLGQIVGDAVATRIRASIQYGGDRRETEITVMRSPGACMTLLHSWATVPGDTPSRTEIVHVIHDITARKTLERELANQRERLELVIQATNVGLWDWNLQTGETVFNERWAEMIGFTLSELAPTTLQTWQKHCHPDDLKKTEVLLARHFDGASESYSCECRMRHKDGHWIWVQDRGRVVQWDEDGRPLRMSGTHTDITERKTAEFERLKSQRQLITAIENIQDGFVLYDAEDRLALCNSRYLELYRTSAKFIRPGARFEDMLRQGVACGQYPEAVGCEAAFIAERLAQHRAAKERVGSPVEQRLDDGTWVRIDERPTADGGLVGLRVDVTQFKQIEEALRQANETLETRVRERTRALEETHSRMVMQEKMASIGMLAAGVAHELNNPINFVRTNFATLWENFADIRTLIADYRRFLRDAAAEGALRRLQQAIFAREADLQLDFILDDLPALFEESERGFNRIARIIHSIRDFSRSEHSGQLCPYNINQGIQDTLVIARNVYKYRARIETELADLPDIHCYPEQLNQVFLNLIVNSVHAIETMQRDDLGAIRIRTWQEGPMICCQFVDDGPGIPETLQSRVFEPFFTTKPPGKGTGLGLSISYDIIVNRHQGQFSVRCPASGGTAFTLCIPDQDRQTEGFREHAEDFSVVCG